MPTSIGWVLAQTQQQHTEPVLVAPVWKGQVWYPVLLEMLVEIPLLIPQREDLIQPTHPETLPEVTPNWPCGLSQAEVPRLPSFRGGYKAPSGIMEGDIRKSYNPLFGKWVGWCSERNADPISCPIGEALNFLSHLFEQGYQYRSLNAYTQLSHLCIRKLMAVR